MSTRIKGRQLALQFGTPSIDYWADQTACVLDNEEADSDTTTFADAAAEGGARQYFLSLTAVQSTDTASFWRYVWEHSGEKVPFVYAPHGNETPSESKPHFVGTCTIGPRPAIGGEAGATSTYTFETRFDVEGTPVMDTGAAA